jgi:hypothetical protein
MRRTVLHSVALLTIAAFCMGNMSYAQVYDDVYYNPGQASGSQSTTTTYSSPSNTSDNNTYGENDYRVYSDDFSSEKYYDEEGNSYVVNNYYYDDNEWDDVSYSTYINRFYTPYYGFGYYAPCYNPWAWNGGWGWNIGWN